MVDIEGAFSFNGKLIGKNHLRNKIQPLSKLMQL